jgi:hypothetical protein
MDITDMAEKVILRVEHGRLVEMEYQVRLSSGKVVDSSEKSGGPVTFICGRGSFPKPVEENIVGLAPGEKKVIFVPPNYIYGRYDPVNVSLVAIERVSGEVQIGKVVKAPDESGFLEKLYPPYLKKPFRFSKMSSAVLAQEVPYVRRLGDYLPVLFVFAIQNTHRIAFKTAPAVRAIII